MQMQMLAPAAVLVLWSLIVMAWMVVTRMGAFKAMGVDLAKSPPGGRGINLDGVAPDKAQWKSHNYNHLMEQPTLFYATCVILALAGAGDLDVRLGWAYVALRIAHSLWQSLVNTIPVRFSLFGLSSLALAVMAVRAVLATMGHG